MTKDQETPSTPKTGFVRRLRRVVLRVSLTLGVAAIAVFAVQLGTQELTRRADAAPSPEPAPAMPVATTPVVLEAGYQVTRSFTGQIEAQRAAYVSFELSGRLSEILVDEGDTVIAGQHIASLDTRLLDAERNRLLASKAALEAQLGFARKMLERQSRLSDRGFASQTALDEARARSDELIARIAEVDAGLMANLIQVEKSQIYAPFAGQIAARQVDGGESVAPGQPLVEVVEISAPHMRVGLPLDILEVDLKAAAIEIDGITYPASLIALRPDVDAATRTRTAIFEIDTTASLNFGQTALLRMTEIVATEGLWVPVTTLKEGLRGQWTLLAVDQANTARDLSVQVLHSKGDQVFVRGAFPEGTQLITSGPHRVTVGQTVDPKPTS